MITFTCILRIISYKNDTFVGNWLGCFVLPKVTRCTSFVESHAYKLAVAWLHDVCCILFVRWSLRSQHKPSVYPPNLLE